MNDQSTRTRSSCMAKGYFIIESIALGHRKYTYPFFLCVALERCAAVLNYVQSRCMSSNRSEIKVNVIFYAQVFAYVGKCSCSTRVAVPL